MARQRSAAQRAPQSKEQALALADEFARLSAEAAVLAAKRDLKLQRIHAVADARLVPMDLRCKDIVAQLKPWFAANLDALTGGRRKSIELGGCVLGYRISPPSVKFDGGNDDAAAAALVAAELDLVRAKVSPDKPSILSLLELVIGEEPTESEQAKIANQSKLRELGFRIHQPEQFFVDLVAKATANTAASVEAAS